MDLDMRQWIVTFGGAGKSPIAPGTAGSLLAALLIYLAHVLWRQIGTPTAALFNCGLILAMLLASIAAIRLGPWAIEHFGRKDPGPFVLDEVAGVCLTMLLLPVLSNWRELWVVLIAFGAFRLFDVTKPPPCRQLEHLSAGWGILMDDLMAAIYANLLCQLLIRLVFRF
jgi:phosphatidylglycerophosphatase A